MQFKTHITAKILLRDPVIESTFKGKKNAINFNLLRNVTLKKLEHALNSKVQTLLYSFYILWALLLQT